MTCDLEVPAHVWPDKHPSEELDYAIDFEPECARVWTPWTDYAMGTRIRVFGRTHASGYEMEATTGGRSGGRPPAFPSTIGATVADGSVVWTARALSSASLTRAIVGTPTWTSDAGITISNQAVNALLALADISGGTDGEDYAVTVTAAASDGNDIVKVCILPVRIPVRVCR